MRSKLGGPCLILCSHTKYWKVVPGGGIEPPTRGFSIEMAINN
jgi:hypothetical protein